MRPSPRSTGCTDLAFPIDSKAQNSADLMADSKSPGAEHPLRVRVPPSAPQTSPPGPFVRAGARSAPNRPQRREARGSAGSCREAAPSTCPVNLPRPARHVGVLGKSLSHQRRQRRIVRIETRTSSPMASLTAAALLDVTPCMRAGSTSRSGARCHRRPRYRTLGGVARCLHLEQQKL